jgi:hypothetical protein
VTFVVLAHRNTALPETVLNTASIFVPELNPAKEVKLPSDRVSPERGNHLAVGCQDELGMITTHPVPPVSETMATPSVKVVAGGEILVETTKALPPVITKVSVFTENAWHVTVVTSDCRYPITHLLPPM